MISVHAGQRFQELHRAGTFVMVNVADAGTAAAVVAHAADRVRDLLSGDPG